MTYDYATTNDLRSFAQRAGWNVLEDWRYLGAGKGYANVYFVSYTGPDPALRALRDTGPFDNEADAWARAIGLAQQEGM